MIRKSLLAALALALRAAGAQAQTEIQLLAFDGRRARRQGERARQQVQRHARRTTRSCPVYKGTYPESMTAAIAAYRAGNAPHILQVFEVGTATMMAAKGAVVPVYKLMKDADEPFNPKAYMPAVAGYYTDSKGKCCRSPSTARRPCST